MPVKSLYFLTHFSMKKYVKHIIGRLAPRTIQEEYQLAKKEHCKPLCVYCGKPLELTQTQYVYIYWYWNEKTHSYQKCNQNGESEPPYCLNCGRQDWDFIDNDLVAF